MEIADELESYLNRERPARVWKILLWTAFRLRSEDESLCLREIYRRDGAYGVIGKSNHAGCYVTVQETGIPRLT